LQRGTQRSLNEKKKEGKKRLLTKEGNGLLLSLRQEGMRNIKKKSRGKRVREEKKRNANREIASAMVRPRGGEKMTIDEEGVLQTKNIHAINPKIAENATKGCSKREKP